MSEMLVMVIVRESTIDRNNLLRLGLTLMANGLAEHGYQMGDPEVIDSEVVTATISPKGSVTSIISVGNSGSPFVSFQVDGVDFDPGRILRNLGSHCSRTYGIEPGVR